MGRRQLGVDLLGREMAVAAAHQAVHEQPGHRHALAALAQGGNELGVEISSSGHPKIRIAYLFEGVTSNLCRDAVCRHQRPEKEPDARGLQLRVVQPALIGLIDGTISTLAPIFAAAYVSGSRAALLVGMAAALGAAISMGLSEGLSDDGSMTGRATRSRAG